MKVRHRLAAGTVGVAGVLVLAAPAGAHVSPSEPDAPAGAFLKFDLRVGHGCGEGDTTKLEVQIPDGIYSATAQVIPGWTITETQEDLPEPVDDGHGGEYTERDAVVTWEGGPLDHGQLEEFGLSVKLPDTPGETIYFPTIQTCDNGETNDWIEIPEEGEDEPERPAPAIALTDAEGDTETAVTTPVAATNPADAGDDGTDGLAVAGLVAGLAGLGLGGTALARTRRTG
jgi:uncharacterized protein YcnI